MALQHMQDNSRKKKVAILTDSAFKLVHGFIVRGWLSKHNELLVRDRNLKAKIRSCGFQAHLFWIPGHANLEGNDVADSAAKAGSSRGKPGVAVGCVTSSGMLIS